ncbi:MAG TPA: ribosome small subunit-dependent GTPase A [Planctomycetota bacterium]|nr:ribosome small subunit-dependent GTPase A [Planctomycetota bacterium]
MSTTVEGLVVHKSSRDIRVETESGTVLCSFRGRLREPGRRSLVVVGDQVLISCTGGEGILEKVLPRRTELVRGTAGGEAMVVAANMDRLLVVLSAHDPPPRWALVDRMLVSAERDSLEPGICVNKGDLIAGDPGEAARLESSLAIYRSLGYAVFGVSALEGTGLDPLRAWLSGKKTVVAGHSGVGKSTLLNALHPGLLLGTGKVNAVTGKGRQTTTAVSLHAMPFGGHVADTPGFREFFPLDITLPELGRSYPEFREVLGGCRYSDCLHEKEPVCCVRKGVEEGAISKLRYGSYLQILQSLREGHSR